LTAAGLFWALVPLAGSNFESSEALPSDRIYAIDPFAALQGHNGHELLDLDFHSEQQARMDFDLSDFVFKFEDEETGPGGSIRGQTITNTPILGTLPAEGIAQTRVTLEACGINQPHIHPAGTEFFYIVSGKVNIGLIEETGKDRREFYEEIHAGQTIVFPRGTVGVWDIVNGIYMGLQPIIDVCYRTS
jgi:quercetin dioxygenase-like cupin family protein